MVCMQWMALPVISFQSDNQSVISRVPHVAVMISDSEEGITIGILTNS